MSIEPEQKPEHGKWRLATREGLVLPLVILGLLVMSTIMIAALLNADDEGRSARAMRLSSEAFYAAEAGLHAVYAGWDSIADVDSLDPGESLTLDWVTLANGTSYRATIRRYDDGVQPIYGLEVSGRGRGRRAGQRRLNLALTSGSGGPGTGYMLGDCCAAPVTIRGAVDMEDDTGIDGHDTNPFNWDSAGVCQDSLYDKPGLIMKDTTQLRTAATTSIDGEPPLVENPDLSDATWDSLGDLAWSDLKNVAEKGFVDGRFSPRPSTTIDMATGEVVCDTSDPLNLGSPDPNHPCFDYFPIVSITDDVKFEFGYAQGIFILDWDESTGLGSELDLEEDAVLSGLILGKGCIEPEENSRTYGAIFVDAEYRNADICNYDYDYDMNDGDAKVQYSTCAIDRALKGSGLVDWAEAAVPGSGGGVQFLGSRAFGERF